VTIVAISEILDAQVTLLGTITGFTPKIIQEGDWSYYVENSDDMIANELPALFVVPLDPIVIEIGGSTNAGQVWTDLGGFDGALLVMTRILCCFEWTEGSEYIDQKISKAKDITDKFVGSAGDAYDMGGATLAGIEVFQTFPVSIELNPSEQADWSQRENSPLAIVAVSTTTKTRAQR
jgi:hypothetical protein